ncbi:MAG TPA: thiamine diphosphokinase [Bacillota bacterium]|nr:thiamine diphosphokinase [Bacillota bacterium]HOK68307.1 thiamine diphosphokinase [Bacillota bacterium]HPP84521.1 thiamine diphosphokinase [Bacillota bacterium]
MNDKGSNQPICYIVGSAAIENAAFAPKAGDFMIAADGGYANLQKAGLQPDLLVGDFDSLSDIPAGVRIIRLPIEKNDTDTLYAVRLGLEKGYKKFYIYGGIGGRLDHTIANIQTLAFIAEQGGTGYLVGGGMTITVIKDGRLAFDARQKGVISIFCLGDKAEGVTLTGLKYPLTDYTMTKSNPIGVSNEFIGTESTVEVRNGMLAILWNGEP